MICIKNIKENNKFNIYISQTDYGKVTNTIHILYKRYNYKIRELLLEEKKQTENYSFLELRNAINKGKILLENIIMDILNMYKSELKNLCCVFLSGSYARGTNKMASDIDLHFFYKNNTYNYIYEEIVCYIISRTIQKSRDCIDPTFILNFSNRYKEKVTSKMKQGNLKISIISKSKKINYSYRFEKKRRFFLQYNNKRTLNRLKKYVLSEVKAENLEWAHCFDVLYGKSIFCKMYNLIYQKEKALIDDFYILNKIAGLKKLIKYENNVNCIKTISDAKKYYQSVVFNMCYEYVGILRFKLIFEGTTIEYINLLNIYDIIKDKKSFNPDIIIAIYKYMWELKKMTIYCRDKNINYGLHNKEKFLYNFSNLNVLWNELREMIDLDLTRMEKQIWIKQS